MADSPRENRRAMSEVPLERQVAVVTGAAQGMGLSIATHLAMAGAQVIICDIAFDTAKIASQKINGRLSSNAAVARCMDVTNESQVHDVVQDVVEQFGRVSILVNNAGILFPTRIADISLQEWMNVVNVNLTGSFLCAKAVIPVMREAHYGRIINLSSSAGRSVSTLGGAHYTAAKAGVLGLTRALAKELASDGILVNAVCPGLINTEMVQSSCDAAQITQYERSFPINRLGEPSEVAEVVKFLCASASYITGASVDVNGGDLMI